MLVAEAAHIFHVYVKLSPEFLRPALIDRSAIFRCDFVGVGGWSVRETATQDASHHDGHWTCRKRGNLVLELRRSRISWSNLAPFLCKCAHALNANKCPLTFAKKIPEVCNFCQV